MDYFFVTFKLCGNCKYSFLFNVNGKGHFMIESIELLSRNYKCVN